jgi:transposase
VRRWKRRQMWQGKNSQPRACRRRAGRCASLCPSNLPRETVTHQTACACAGYGSARAFIGENVAEVLELVPERFKVIRHVRRKFFCTACQTITQSAAPSRPIARCLAGRGLLAHVLVSKFCDHLLLYRQIRYIQTWTPSNGPWLIKGPRCFKQRIDGRQSALTLFNRRPSFRLGFGYGIFDTDFEIRVNNA